MTSTNDSAGLGRRALLRVGAGAATAVASASSATAQTPPADSSRDAVALQDDGNETSGNQTGGNQTGGNGTEGNGTGSNETGGNETGGSDGNGEGGDHDGSTSLGDVTSNPLALVGLAAVLAFLSPFALVALLLRNAGDEADQY